MSHPDPLSRSREVLIADLRKASTAVYLATEESVADHLSQLLREAAAALTGGPPLPMSPPDWKLPVRFDGTDLLDASNRILVWEGEAGERTGRYLARLINAAGEVGGPIPQPSASSRPSASVEALRALTMKWRAEAAVCGIAEARADVHEIVNLCADQLEAALASLGDATTRSDKAEEKKADLPGTPGREES